jgi:hypothetical protein
MKTFKVFHHVSLLMVILLTWSISYAQSFDLTGLWHDNTTGSNVTYRVRQIGNAVYWSADGAAVGAYANVFFGEISGNTLSGTWVDLPGSPSLGGGNLTLQIQSNDWFVKIGEDPCCYGAQEWIRQGTTGGGDSSTRAIDWRAAPGEHRGKNGQRFSYSCPPSDSLAFGLWGTDIYTDDSSICLAAVHVGLISPQQGGVVTIEILSEQQSYTGSTRNGVTTGGWGYWAGSFRFIY